MSTTPVPSVIIAEPERVTRTLLSAAIRRAAPDASVRFALDSRGVLDLASTQAPDLVVLHHALPRTDIGGLCARLRATYGDVPIYVTGATAADARRLGEVGVIALATAVRTREELAAVFRPVLPGPRAPRRREPASTRPLTLPGPWRTRGAATPAPAAPTPPTRTAVSPGEIIGRRYLLEERLGDGGMGSVFAARHLDLDKRFAVKILASDLATAPDARATFLGEAKLACRLAHPNIVSVVDFGTDPRRGVYMVMELLSGPVLSVAAARLSLRRRFELLGQIADALDVLHRHDVVHGDVKTDNVMVVEEPDGPRRRTIARLIDFGLAHRISHRPGKGLVAGTPEYMAPERVRGGAASVAADVYALGIIAYEVLTGRLPFAGPVEEVLKAQLDREVPALAARDGQPLDPAATALVLRALRKDPAQRHATAAAFRYELNAVMNMLGYTRTARAPDESKFGLVFHRSALAQAVVGPDGQVQLANDAFRALVPNLDALVASTGEIADALARARQQERSTVSARLPGAEGEATLLFMFAPTGTSVHVVATPLDA